MKLKISLASITILSMLGNISGQVNVDLKERPKPVETFNFQKISANNEFIYILGVEDKNGKSTYYTEKYNSTTLNLEYQKNLNICEDDKNALVHPGIMPPICFEINNRLLVFYCSYTGKDDIATVNLKLVNEQGEASKDWKVLFSSKDINVRLDGFYTNYYDEAKPVIRYYLSDDKTRVLIYVNSEKYNKILSFKIDDLVAGRNDYEEFDLRELINAESIILKNLFCVNNVITFTYIKKVSETTEDFGFAVLENNTKQFRLKNLDLKVSAFFSETYYIDHEENSIILSGYTRTPIDASGEMSLENSKVNQLYTQFDLNSFSFRHTHLANFLPSIAKYISVPEKAYGFIRKGQTPDHYLNTIGFVGGADYYYNISQVVLYIVPGMSNPMRRGEFSMNVSGISTVCRDILISKFDKFGVLTDQYLLPFHTAKMGAFIGGRWSAVKTKTNKMFGFAYVLKEHDLHLFYLDNPENTYDQVASYDPRNTKKATIKNSVLIDMSIKGNKITREVLTEPGTKCVFYSDQNLIINNSVIVDLIENDINTEVGRIIVK